MFCLLQRKSWLDWPLAARNNIKDIPIKRSNSSGIRRKAEQSVNRSRMIQIAGDVIMQKPIHPGRNGKWSLVGIHSSGKEIGQNIRPTGACLVL